jgi:hemoglobin/transferrin/lactoferrin receptor protein
VTEVFVSGQHPNAGPGSNFDFLPNPNLRPEIGKTREVGINIRQDGLFVPNDALRIKANVFQNDVTDFIEQATILFGNPGVGGQTCT